MLLKCWRSNNSNQQDPETRQREYSVWPWHESRVFFGSNVPCGRIKGTIGKPLPQKNRIEVVSVDGNDIVPSQSSHREKINMDQRNIYFFSFSYSFSHPCARHSPLTQTKATSRSHFSKSGWAK
mmetsp:Transcript_1046/g.2365  ORF Transcript_1046/g.2365 Transcript_1046/m.2365 type:complete len:124 (-) Transcript_1046:479-850(-)